MESKLCSPRLLFGNPDPFVLGIKLHSACSIKTREAKLFVFVIGSFVHDFYLKVQAIKPINVLKRIIYLAL